MCVSVEYGIHIEMIDGFCESRRAEEREDLGRLTGNRTGDWGVMQHDNGLFRIEGL